MKRGFVRQYRKEVESDIWKMQPIYHRVWRWILLKAKWKKEIFPTQKNFGIHVNPGQLITSYDLIAEGVGWQEWGKEKKPNKKTIKTVLEWLESNGQVTVESNAKGTFINVTNWDTYNNTSTDKVTENNQEDGDTKKRLLETIKELEELKKKLNKKPKTLKTFSSDSVEYRLSELLFLKIKENNPEAKEPNIKEWARHIDLMLRVDKRDPQKIANVIGWCQKDGFWMTNILSAKKLREKYEQLVAKMGVENGTTRKGNRNGGGFCEARKSGETDWLG